jgi:hypothetical protein
LLNFPIKEREPRHLGNFKGYNHKYQGKTLSNRQTNTHIVIILCMFGTVLYILHILTYLNLTTIRASILLAKYHR